MLEVSGAKRLIAEFLFLVSRLWPLLLWMPLLTFVVVFVWTQNADVAVRWALTVLVLAVLFGPFGHMQRSDESRAMILLSLLWMALLFPVAVLVLDGAGL